MKGKVTIMGAGFLLATGLTVAAYAQAQPTTAVQAPAKAEAVRTKADMLAMANAQFDRMDANRDGRIDANDRRAQTKARFAEIDADKNGSISEDELAQAHSRPMASGKGEHKRRHGAGRHGGMRGANGMMLRMEGRVPLVAAAAMCHFVKDSLVQQVLHRIKYGGDREAALELGRLYGQELAEQEAFRGVAAVVPVPLHAARLHRRGYNQSAWFGRGLADALGCNCLEEAMERVRATETQTRKTLAERQANVASAFRLRDPAPLEGRYVLLVDDVFTTGATLEACAAELLQVPGLRLGLVTLAVAAPD